MDDHRTPAFVVSSALALLSFALSADTPATPSPLRGAGALHGRVVDASTGKPVAGALLALGCDKVADAATRSTSDGTYRFGSVSGSGCALKVELADYVPWEHYFQRPATTAEQRLDVALDRGATVVGRVVDEQGIAVAGASGQIESAEAWPRKSRRFVSDASGHFRGDGQLAGSGLVLRVEHPDFAPGMQSGVNVVAGQTAGPFTIALARGAVLQGRVIDGKAEPVAGAAVSVGSTGVSRGLHSEGHTQTTGADGKFVTQRLPGGTYELAVRAPEYQILTTLVELGREPLVARDVRLLPAAQISGRVVDTDGVGMRAYYVETRVGGDRRSNAFTDDQGRFTLGALAPDQAYELIVYRDGPELARTTLKAPASDVRFVVPREGRIAGLVRDEHGRPIQQFKVKYDYAPPPGRSSSTSGRRSTASQDLAISDPEGRFTVEDVPATTLTLTVSVAGRPPVRLPDIDVPSGTTASVEAVVTPGVPLDVRVRSAEGGVLPGAKVAVRTVESEPRHWFLDQVADGNGWLEQVVAPGAYEIAAAHDDWAPAIARITVLAGTPARVDLRLAAGARIEGQLVAGVPNLAGVKLELEPEDRLIERLLGRTTVSDPAGRFVLDRLLPGRYRLEATVPGLAASPLDVVIAEALGTTKVEFELEPRVHLRGRVTGLPPGQIGAVNLSAWLGPREGPSRASARTSADGSFAMDLPPGEVYVEACYRASRDEQRCTGADLTVADGRQDSEVEVRFGRGLRLGGRVLAASGGFVQGARVRIGAPAVGSRNPMVSARSDSEGRFVLLDLPAGQHTVMASVDGPDGRAAAWGSALVSLEADRAGFELTLDHPRVAAAP